MHTVKAKSPKLKAQSPTFKAQSPTFKAQSLTANGQRPTANVLCILLTVFAAGCYSSDAKKNEADSVTSVTAVHTFSLKKDKLASTLRMPGELVAFQQVDLYAKVNSFVKKLQVDVGSEVKEGQLLATLEAPEINSQLSGAESKLKSLESIYIGSKANYNRLLETSKTPGTISPNELDLAHAKEQSDLANLEAAKAAYREVGDNRNYLVIRAPFDGIITARNVSEGAYVGPSGKGSDLPIFTLQEQKKLRLVVSVPEAYTAWLRNKNEVNFTVKSLPDEKFTANINRMAGALDYKLRSQRIEMDVINRNKKLLPGMVAEITISMPGQDSTYLVPEDALMNTAQGYFIIRAENGKANWVEVKKGRTLDGKIEIYGPVKTDDQLIEHASEEIRNGSVIK